MPEKSRFYGIFCVLDATFCNLDIIGEIIVNKVKKIPLLFVIVASIVSCSLDDDEANFHYEFVPVVAAQFPENFVLGDTYTIPVEFARPTECHFFSNFSFESPETTTRRIGVVNSVFTDRECPQTVTDEAVKEMSFDFMVLYEGTYTFQFWIRENADGSNEYLEIQVPVVAEERVSN